MKKTISRCQTKRPEILELSDKEFQAVVIKMLQWAITDMLKTTEKKQIKSLSKESKCIAEPKGNFRTENYNNQNFKT